MKTDFQKGPFSVKTSFAVLKDFFEQKKGKGNAVQQAQADWALKIFEENPALIEGFDTREEMEKHQQSIEELMSFLFPDSLALNELKSALYPLSSTSFYDSERMKKLKKESEDAIVLDFLKMYEENTIINIIPYSVILSKYYQYNIDFNRPLTIPLQLKNGQKKKFRVTYNADFISITPTENAIEITEDILDELLSNTHDTQLWEKYFPKNSWRLEGFGLMTMIDITLDEQIDVFKEHLIGTFSDTTFETVESDIRNIFNIPDLYVGSTMLKGKMLQRGYDEKFQSVLLGEQQSCELDELGCAYVRDKIMNKHEMVIIPNIDKYAVGDENNHVRQNMLDKNLKSLALIPVTLNGDVENIMEIGGYQKNQINEINIVKLDDIMPFILSFIESSNATLEYTMNAIIQEECTSIHPAVKWKFDEEAMRFFGQQMNGESPVFQEIVFENVIPLYGQIDIVGSSSARNAAIQHDLQLLLEESLSILKEVTGLKKLPFYEQLLYETEENLTLVENTFHTNTEQIISDFFELRLLPVLTYFSKSNHNSQRIEQFLEQLDSNNSLYLARRKYDATVDSINRELAQFIDEKQHEAQAIFPHYFQKYKTDGVEHDLYVGQSITREELYHESVLYNLRLWQMQIMCEMEARYYQMQEQYPINLNVASLIFAYDAPMSIRYRIDEKQFDVDGAYNVRYEMIKKRIDKAHIKGTDERLTQPHKLSVVYSNSNMEREYLSYFKFLQTKGYFGEEIEILELEDLQGAVGMKAIRATINHNLQEAEKVYRLEDVESSH